MAAVRTTPTRATACSRCSGTVQAMRFCLSARTTDGAFLTASVANLSGKVDRVRADDRHEVEGGGHHRLQEAVGNRWGSVLLSARFHLSDCRGCRAAPGVQVRGDAIVAEQLPIVDQ